jgi:hypothetical protein
MGSPADNTQAEIGRLREDMAAAVLEIQRRFQRGLPSAVTNEVRLMSGELRTGFSSRLHQNANLVGFAGTVAVCAIGYGAVSAIGRRRANQTPAVAPRAALSLAENLPGLRGLEQLRRGGVLLKLDQDKGGYVRVTDARLAPEPPPVATKEAGSHVVKRLGWALLLTVFMAAGSVLARRLAGMAWRAAVQEEPPGKS